MLLLLTSLACGEPPDRVHVPPDGFQTASVNGLELAYFEHGTGPLVLMVHGFPDTPFTWDDIAEPVAAAGFRVVTPWLRGYAPSEVPGQDAFDYETLGRDVLAWITALGEDSAVLVGHDWGALSVYSAVLQDPAPVEKLVTVAIPHPGFWEPKLADFWNGRHFIGLTWDKAEDRFAADDYSGVEKFFSRWSPEWDYTDTDTEPVKNCYAAPGTLNAALGFYRDVPEEVPAFMQAPVSVPTWSFAGTSDLIAPSVYEELTAGFSSDYTVIELDGGHFMQREDLDRFVEELLAILGEPT